VSGDPVSVVRSNSAAFSARDVERMLEHYARDAVVEDRRPTGWGAHRGHAELRAYYLGIFDNADALDESLEVLAADGDVVVAHCDLWVHLAADESAEGLTIPYGLIVTVRDGRIAQLAIHSDGREALAASRLG
jgi:ketosteroid isomerase-like protein